MIENTEKDGFDIVINEDEKNLPEINIGGTAYFVKPASKFTEDTTFLEAVRYLRKLLPSAENDTDLWKATDKEDAKTTAYLMRMYGVRIQTMKDYRLFFAAYLNKKHFRAAKSIMCANGTEYVSSTERMEKVLKAFNVLPSLFEEVNDKAKWPEFDAKEAKKEAEIAKAEAKAGPQPEPESQDFPNE